MNERRENRRVRLSLLGELDLASVPVLEDKLHSLRDEGQFVQRLTKRTLHETERPCGFAL